MLDSKGVPKSEELDAIKPVPKSEKLDAIKPVPKSEELDSTRLVYKDDRSAWERGKSNMTSNIMPD